jgi:NAD(P)-dependent dehydrogenase (short-subunit alcohol dehydrogenase family)
MRRYEGKGVIVTGAGRGIGQATAQRFASEGADVMLIGRTLEALEGTAELVRSEGGSAWAHSCDVRDSSSVREAVAAACARWDGRIDVLVNNAGIDDETPFLEMTEEAWRSVVDTNLTGPFLFSRAVAAEMVRTGGGVILHNASIDASGGDGPFASYNASKAGLLGLNRTMALELAPHGIRVNSIHPTGVDTPLNDGLAAMEGMTTQEIAERSAGNLLPVPWIEASDVAAAVLYLAGESARYVTGTTLVIDAGLLTR